MIPPSSLPSSSSNLSIQDDTGSQIPFFHRTLNFDSPSLSSSSSKKKSTSRSFSYISPQRPIRSASNGLSSLNDFNSPHLTPTHALAPRLAPTFSLLASPSKPSGLTSGRVRLTSREEESKLKAEIFPPKIDCSPKSSKKIKSPNRVDSKFSLSLQISPVSLRSLSPPPRSFNSSLLSLESPPRPSLLKRAEALKKESESELKIQADGIDYQKIDYTQRPPIVDNVFAWSNERYEIRNLKSTGRMSRIWEFSQCRTIVFKGLELTTSHIIGKSPLEARKEEIGKVLKRKRDGRFFEKELKQTIKTHLYFEKESTKLTLKKLGLHLPVCYFTPLDKDRFSTNTGGFWIVEKMERSVSSLEWKNNNKKFEELSQPSRKFLETVKAILTYMFHNENCFEEKLRFLDIHMGNLMYNAKDELCYIDGGMHWEDEDEFSNYAGTGAKAISEGNPHIHAFLKENFKGEDEKKLS